MINPDSLAIQYAAETELVNLIETACTTNKKVRQNDKFNQAGAIYYLLDALTTSEDYLEDDQINNILECLKQTAELYDYPIDNISTPLSAPVINIGPQGPQGEQGERGEDGGATDFSLLNSSTNGVADSFPYTQAYAARWDVLINGDAQRAGSVWATWLEDGSSVTFTPEIGTGDLNGSTSGIELTVTIFGSEVRLNAIISSGTWTITGSRYLIPNNGVGVNPPSGLQNGYIWVGNSSNAATAVSVSGDISISNSGVVSYTPLSIVNGDISASAAIAVSKLATLTVSRAVVSDSSGFLTTSSATSTEIGYLSGVTSNIQTQLDSKLSAATGAISTVVSTNLTASRAVVSDPSGKIAISGTTSTEIGYLSGVTSNVQTQLNSRVADTGDTMTGTLVLSGASVGINTDNVVTKTKKVTFTGWNMDADITKSVPHGLSDYTKIIRIDVRVVNNAGSVTAFAGGDLGAGNYILGNYFTADATNVFAVRQTGTSLDDAAWNNASGAIFIQYEV